METYFVIDKLYSGEEGNVVFSGTKEDCENFIYANGGSEFAVIPEWEFR